MKTAKDAILKLIPTGETALRSAIQSSSGTKKSLGHTLITAFGFNTSLWADWQKEVETTYLNTPDSHFATAENDSESSVEEWLLKAVGQSFDTDGHHGAQCKDFANAYAQWLGVPLQPSDAAKTWEIEQTSYWQKIPYRPDSPPQTGDIVVWGPWAENSYGHIAVVLDATNDSFRSVDQNWDSQDITKGSPAAIIEHSYTKPQILGFLRPTLT